MSIAKLSNRHLPSGRKTTMDAMIDTTIRQGLAHLDPSMDPTSAILAGMSTNAFGGGAMMGGGMMGGAVMGGGMVGGGMVVGSGSVLSRSSDNIGAAPSATGSGGGGGEAGYERVQVVKVDTWGLDLGQRRKEMGLVPTISPLPKRHRPAPFMRALIKSADDRAGGKKGTGPFSDSEPKAASPGKRKDSRAKRSPNGKGKAPGGSGSGGGRKAGPGALNAADALLEL